jgi:hypothetical protein
LKEFLSSQPGIKNKFEMTPKPDTGHGCWDRPSPAFQTKRWPRQGRVGYRKKDDLGAGSGTLGGPITKAVRPHLSTTVFMFLVMVCGAFLVLTYMLLVDMPVTFNNDPYTGLFGWMNLEGYRLYVLMHIALICNLLGTMGFVRVMQYFDNIIMAVATLLEPMAATLIAFALGVANCQALWDGLEMVSSQSGR